MRTRLRWQSFIISGGRHAYILHHRPFHQNDSRIRRSASGVPRRFRCRRQINSALENQSAVQPRKLSGNADGVADRLWTYCRAWRPSRKDAEQGRIPKRVLACTQLPQLCGLCADGALCSRSLPAQGARRRAPLRHHVRRGCLVAMSSPDHHRLPAQPRRRCDAHPGGIACRRGEPDAWSRRAPGWDHHLSGRKSEIVISQWRPLRPIDQTRCAG